MIDNTYLDGVRCSLMETWDCSSFFVWHREYKDYDEVQCPYAGKPVIVAQFRGQTQIHDGNKSGYFPFIYQNVSIILWK